MRILMFLEINNLGTRIGMNMMAFSMNKKWYTLVKGMNRKLSEHGRKKVDDIAASTSPMVG